jgi:hypothetical protein
MFQEKLRVPVQWWFIATLGVAIGGAEVFAGFSWPVIVIVYSALGVPTLALLLGMGRATVRVDADGLHAGGRTLPREEITSARALDARQARHRLGPGHDPRAQVLVRGFVKTAVLVQTTADSPAPYWLVSTRRSDELLAALGRAGTLTG